MSGATDRLPRLLALVPYLLAHPGTSLAELSRVFGVPERQLRKDLDLVWMCGLPGHTPGDLIDVEWVGNTVTVSNADTIARPLRLTPDEALALLVALRTLADVPGLSERDALDRARVKIETAVGAVPAADGLSVALNDPAELDPAVLTGLQAAHSSGRRVHLRYYVPGRDEVTERDVDPMRLLFVDGRWYLEGWDRSVEDVRFFRLDRVLAQHQLSEAADIPEQAQPRDLSSGLFSPSPQDTLVTLVLEPSARWVADYYPCETVQDQPDGTVLARLRSPDPGWLLRLALQLGGAGRIVDPPELAEAVRSAARAALAAYADGAG